MGVYNLCSACAGVFYQTVCENGALQDCFDILRRCTFWQSQV